MPTLVASWVAGPPGAERGLGGTELLPRYDEHLDRGWSRPPLPRNRGLAGEPAVHRAEAELGRVIAGLARRRNAFQRLQRRPASKHRPETRKPTTWFPALLV